MFHTYPTSSTYFIYIRYNDSSIIHRSVSTQTHSSLSLIFSHVILLFTIFNTCCVGGCWDWTKDRCDQWGRRIEGWPNTVVRLTGWRRVTRQVWFYTWWTGRPSCLFSTVPVALIGAAQLRVEGISSCCYILNIHNHPSWARSRKAGMAWYSSRPMTSLWHPELLTIRIHLIHVSTVGFISQSLTKGMLVRCYITIGHFV